MNWRWAKVQVVHQQGSCAGVVHRYVYRHHPAGSSAYERCIGLAWCSDCRDCSSAMVHVPADVVCVDALAGLDPVQRERVLRSQTRLLDHLDRLARRGQWPPK